MWNYYEIVELVKFVVLEEVTSRNIFELKEISLELGLVVSLGNEGSRIESSTIRISGRLYLIVDFSPMRIPMTKLYRRSQF